MAIRPIGILVRLLKDLLLWLIMVGTKQHSLIGHIVHPTVCTCTMMCVNYDQVLTFRGKTEDVVALRGSSS